MRTVRDKAEMYRRLAAGEFGNTTRQWFDLGAWSESPDRFRYGWWGVRSLTPGGPCRLNCPAAEVGPTVAEYERAGHRCNVSVMVDRMAAVTAWLEVWESPAGLVVEGIEYPDTAGGWTWRNSMPDPTRRRRWEGVVARFALARHLNENSADDLRAVLEAWPGHVVELSALDRCVGVVPHRNAVVWEVRDY